MDTGIKLKGSKLRDTPPLLYLELTGRNHQQFTKEKEFQMR
jgi:hypothetical protein